jgi:hypothetical protein
LGGNPADALTGAVRNAQIDFGGGGATTGVSSLGVPEGVGGQGAAPVGQVTVSPLGPPSPNLVSLAQQLFGSSAAQAARGSGSSTSNSANLGPTLGGAAPTAATTMGFPAAGIGAAPGGGVGSTSTNGTTIGQATIAAPPTNPDVPAVGSVNATTGLGSSAPAAAANAASPSAPSSPSPTAPNAPTAPVDMGGLIQLVMSLVLGGNPGPQLTQLAQATRPQLAPTTQTGA